MPIATGIDVGAHSIKLVQLRRSGGTETILRAGAIDLEELGRLEDSDRKCARIGALMKALFAQVGVRPKHAIAAASSQALMLRYIHVPPVPPWRLAMLMKYEIEAESPEDDITSDYRLLDLPGLKGDYTALAAIARTNVIEDRMALLAEGGVRPDTLSISPVGLFHAVREQFDPESEETWCVIDVGAETTDVIVSRFGKLYFARSLSIGGRAFTEALASEFEIPFAQAEEMKLTTAKIQPDGLETRESRSLTSAAEQIFSGVQSAIMFCKAQTRLTDLSVSKVLLTGGGALVRGLPETLAGRFRCPVEMLDPAVGIAPGAKGGLPDERDPAEFSLALGLARQALDTDDTFGMGLLPASELRRRRVRERDVYAWAAGVVFALGLTALVLTAFHEESIVGGRLALEQKRIETGEQARESFDEVVVTHKTWESNVGAMEVRASSGLRLLEALRAIRIATNDVVVNRLSWGRSHEDEDGFSAVMYLEGYVTSTTSEPAARETLRQYSEGLEKDEVFSRSKVISSPVVETEDGDGLYVVEFKIELRTGEA